MTTAIHDTSIAVATTLLIELCVVFTAVYTKMNRRAENLVYAVLCLLFSCVLLSARMMQVAPDIATGVVWYRIQLSVAALTVATVLDFAFRVSRPLPKGDTLRLVNAVRDTQHEVKNGLGTLQYRLESALNNLPEHGALDARKHLAMGMKQFEAVSLTLDMMLDVARLEAGQPLSLGRQAPTDLPDLVRSVCLRQIAAEQESDEETCLRQMFAERFRIEICLNAARYYVFARFLVRVLANLINNAWKYSPANTPILIHLEESRGQEPGESRLHLRVTDEGIGIDASDLELIFERPFYRTSSATQMPGHVRI